MAITRKGARKRLKGLARRVEQHLRKLAVDPTQREAKHWKWEVTVWIAQMESVLPRVGRRTRNEWTDRINEWRKRLED